MLQKQIEEAETVLDAFKAIERDGPLPDDQAISKTRVSAWSASTERLIGRMFGEDSAQVAHFRWLWNIRRDELLRRYCDELKAADWRTAYWIAFFEEARAYLSGVDAEHLDGKPSNVQTIIHGDSYSHVQGGIVGRGNSVSNSTFDQKWQAMDPPPDLDRLAAELKQLRNAMRAAADTAEDHMSIAGVANAEEAAGKGDGPAALEAMKSAGRWALGVSEKIGTGVATAALKTAMGV